MCKLQGSMPVMSVFQTISISRYNIKKYASVMSGKTLTSECNGYPVKTWLSKN